MLYFTLKTWTETELLDLVICEICFVSKNLGQKEEEKKPQGLDANAFLWCEIISNETWF